MSYILDALRRADAERDRGQVPGLHAQPAPPAATATPARPGGLALGLGGGLILALAAGLAWWSWPRATQPPAVAAPPAAATATPPAAATLPPPATAAVAPPAVAAAPVPLPRVVSAPPLPVPPLPAATEPAPPATPAAPAAARAPTADRAAAAASAPRTLTLAEMTPEQRRDWPRLAIGGVVHSDHAASRFVVVDGRLVHEGEEAAPGVTVERIGARAAILRWRGLRVELPY